MKKALLPLSVSILLLLSSCSIFTRASLSNASIGDKCYLNATIFQAVNSHEALATTSHELNSIVVKLITSEDTYYDGKKVSGSFIMVDTYTYENKQNTILFVANQKRQKIQPNSSQARKIPQNKPEKL